MTQVSLPYRPQPGDPEDITQILADFDAILNVLNGDVRNDNIAAAAAILISKLAGGNAGDYIEMVGAVPTWQKRCNARVTRGANQSIPHAAHTPITFTTEEFDTDGMSDISVPGPNPTRLTIATAGKYLVGGSMVWAPGAAGPRIIYVRKGGSTAYGWQEVPAVTAPDGTAGTTTVFLPLNVGDYLELIAYQTSGGGALTVSGCEFWATRQGA